MQPDQPTLDDALEEGRRRRDRGVERASLNTYTPHQLRYLEVIERLAATGDEFTSDDVLEEVGHVPLGSPGALGALFSMAVSRGIIRPVGHVQSRRPSRHGGWNRSFRGA